MNTWLADFSFWLIDTNRSAATEEAYLADINAFSDWFEQENGEEFSPSLLNGPDLRTWARITKSTVRAATWNRKRSAMRVFCTWALMEHYITYDPFVDVPVAEQEELPTRWLTDQEYHRLIRQAEINVNRPGSPFQRADAVRNRTIIGLGVYAGLREAEICALTLNDVQISERSGRIIIQHGKGNKHREVPASRELRLILCQWFDMRGEENGRLISISPRQVQRVVSEVGRQAKIDALTPHALRHTFAKRLLRSGVDLATVSKLLGHSRIETTKRYVQPGWEDFENAVEEL